MGHQTRRKRHHPKHPKPMKSFCHIPIPPLASTYSSVEVGRDFYGLVNNEWISKVSVPLFENDNYILKTQVVPPVCPTCPGLGSAPYSAHAENNQERREGRQVDRYDTREGRVERRVERQGSGYDTVQNNNVSPQLNAQREFNQSNNDYDFGPNSLTNNNNIDNYEPQPMLNDFSNF